jgi:hypothetical protein
MRCGWLRAAASLTLMVSLEAGAHSASDAYLTFSVAPAAAPAGEMLIHGQWDIALRDLDFVLHLDEDGDGRLTWGEVRRQQSAIERYAYASLHVGGASARCLIRPVRQMIDEHADGAYAALFFDVICAKSDPVLTVDYQLFFPIDPSHRGILVMQSGSNVATAVLSPKNARIELQL